jgi:hypothetical protein
MQKNKTQPTAPTEQELLLIKQLREHPQLLERFQTILDITRNADGPLKSADEVEGLLIQEVRRLGNASMSNWATHAERRLGEQLKQKDPSVYEGKKKR